MTTIHPLKNVEKELKDIREMLDGFQARIANILGRCQCLAYSALAGVEIPAELGPPVEVKFDNKPLSKENTDALFGFLVEKRERGYYGAIPDRILNEVSKKFEISKKIVRWTWKQVQNEATAAASVKIESAKASILDCFKGGTPLKELSREYDIKIDVLMSIILKMMGKTAKKVLNDLPSHFEGELLHYLEKAKDCLPRKANTHAHATKFEHRVQKYLEEVIGLVQGEHFFTEADLKKAQGRCPHSTPDFLITCGLKFDDGKIVHWIDAKNFFGTKQCGYALDKAEDQVRRYNVSYGRGAIFFGLGFDTSVSISNTINIDASAL